MATKTKTAKTKKAVKVRDLKPKKDDKGRRHPPPGQLAQRLWAAAA